MKNIVGILYRYCFKPVLSFAGFEDKFVFFTMLVSAYTYDLRRYYTWSKTDFSSWNKIKLVAQIYEGAHSIEKGLAIHYPRLGFGQEKVQRLLFCLDCYKNKYGFDATILMALEVLDEYLRFNRQNGISLTDIEVTVNELKKSISDDQLNLGLIASNLKNTKIGGTYVLERNEILKKVKGSFEDLVLARHSVRMFAKTEVSLDRIKEAIKIAQHTPSSCNRQSWRVRVFSEREQVSRLLAIQKGSRGFSEEIPVLILITSELRFWDSVNERYQAYIDGGMFAMTLVHALTYQGLATCCLNLALEPKRDKTLRHLANIPVSETFIMMIATGEFPEHFAATVSHRRSFAEICQIS